MNDDNRRCARCDARAVQVHGRQASGSALRWHGDDDVIQLERVEGTCVSCAEQQTWYEPIDPQPQAAR
jgi:hypothetical protein